MLCIVSKFSPDINIHIGDKFPDIFWLGVKDVTAIKADLDELKTLYIIFPDLPKSRLSEVIFVGETAKFIATNLASKTFQLEALKLSDEKR